MIYRDRDAHRYSYICCGGGMYIYTETNSSSISGEAPEIITSQ